MTTSEIIFAALAALVPIISVIVAILALRRNTRNDTKEEAKEFGSMKADLAYIKAGIDDLKANDKAKDQRLDTLSDHLARLEASFDAHIKDKNAHNYSKYPTPKQGGHK